MRHQANIRKAVQSTKSAGFLPCFKGWLKGAVVCGLVTCAGADVGAEDWPMFGGNASRNFANTQEKDIPGIFDVSSGENILWSAELGSKGYGGPVVGAGKVFVGTNNQNPRDPAIQGDKGVLMCFDEKSGEFLWQLVFDKLGAGRVQDWPEEEFVPVRLWRGTGSIL